MSSSYCKLFVETKTTTTVDLYSTCLLIEISSCLLITFSDNYETRTIIIICGLNSKEAIEIIDNFVLLIVEIETADPNATG